MLNTTRDHPPPKGRNHSINTMGVSDPGDIYLGIEQKFLPWEIRPKNTKDTAGLF